MTKSKIIEIMQQSSAVAIQNLKAFTSDESSAGLKIIFSKNL